MRKMRHVFVFIANDIKRLRRKWLTLPLLFISPLVFIGLLLWVISNLISFDDKDPIEVGLVNLDDSDATELIVSALADTAEVAEGLDLVQVNAEEAEQKISDDELVSYIIFPEKFTDKMMRGESSELEVVGNPNQELESYVVNSVIDTVVRHIRNSQANILTINHYAREFDMSDEAREALIFREFVSQFIQVLSSDTLMDEHEESQNISAGYMYFIVNGLFIVITIWVYMMHVMLMRAMNGNLQARLKVSGVSVFSIGLSKVLLAGTIVAILSILLFATVLVLTGTELPLENIGRIAVLMLLHIYTTAMLLVLIGWLMRSFKLAMILQLCITVLILLFAGSIIPRIYFPVYLDPVFDYIYSYQALFWIEEIMLNGRFTSEINIMLITLLIAFTAFVVTAVIKERG